MSPWWCTYVRAWRPGGLGSQRGFVDSKGCLARELSDNPQWQACHMAKHQRTLLRTPIPLWHWALGKSGSTRKYIFIPSPEKNMFCFKVLLEGRWGAHIFLVEWTNIAWGICLYLIIFKHDLVLQGWVLNSPALFQGAWRRISFQSNTEDVRGWALSLLRKHLKY